MKRVLITGGVNGLGQSLAAHYALLGFSVSVLDVEHKENEPNISYHAFDLKNFSAADLSFISEAFDIVICNAGISVSGNFVEIQSQVERDVFEINLFGHMELIRYLLKNNLVNDYGRIAFICSASVYLSFPIAVAYASSKSALDGFAHALESYVYKQNISISRIYPGPMNTGHSKYYPGAQTEGGRFPKDSVPAIVRGIEKRQRKITPDPISRVCRLASRLAPKFLTKTAYNTYKERF